MAGLVPAIHVFLAELLQRKTWMPATSAGMTAEHSLYISKNGRDKARPSRIHL